MFKRKLTINDLFLILVNLVPLYGVWFEGWDPSRVFVVYCLETVIVGIMNVLKMAAVTLLVNPKGEWNNNGSHNMLTGWFFIFFFIIHYGFFVLIQTQIFFSFSKMDIFGPFFSVYTQIPALLGDEGKLLIGIFFVYYSLDTLFNFFLTGEYKKITLMELMFQPYKRIIVQQLIVIGGSLFLMFGAGKIFMLIMVCVKIYFELFFPFNRVLKLSAKKEFDSKEAL
ncbi:MAG: DUF6498-containing protein [Chitinophagaceae bacterium]